jgi:cytidine deaminase
MPVTMLSADKNVVDQALLDAASEARECGNPRMSGFRVGAALRAADGDIYVGANAELLEGHFLHAEQAALMAGQAAKKKVFIAAAVVADGDFLITPCGSCRGWLNTSLPSKAPIYCKNLRDGETKTFTMQELLPHAPNLVELGHDVALLTPP